MTKIKKTRRLGIKIAAVSLFATAFLFLITQSVWTGSQDVVNNFNGSSVASLIFALLAFLTSSLIMVTIFTKFNLGRDTRPTMLAAAALSVLFIVISFSVSIGHQFADVDGPKVAIANTLFFALGMSTYAGAEFLINKNKFRV